MNKEWKFCTITTTKDKEFECTVKVVNGSSQPKDVWYFDKWLSIGRFEKLESNNFSIHSYRDAF